MAEENACWEKPLQIPGSVTFTVRAAEAELPPPIAKADYKNEVEVGEALTESFKTGLIKREDLFITTKV